MSKDAISSSYSHYNTFHGSEAYNYLSIGQVFRNRSFNANPTSTNSSPDLNQQLAMGSRHHKKSFSVIYHDLMKVRYIRPLETLHNNLCFKVLNNFLTRMVNDKQDETNEANKKTTS